MRTGFHIPAKVQHDRALEKAQQFIEHTEAWLERLKIACQSAQLPFDDEAETEDMLRWAYDEII